MAKINGTDSIQERVTQALAKKESLIIAAVLLAALATWGGYHLAAKRAMKRAEVQLQKSLPNLAADTVEEHRHAILTKKNGCETLLAIYFAARNPERLEWAAEGCLDLGKDIPEVYIGLAAVREFTNRDNEALQILNGALGKFDKDAQIPFRMAQIFRRNKKDNEAVLGYNEALRRSPGNQQLAFDAMTYLAGLNRWVDAKKIADTLKTAKTDNPEIKLVLARVLQKGGDQSGAREMADQAKPLLEKSPVKADLEKAYGDLLGIPGATAPANTPAKSGK